jgi:hypothetical protein
MGYTFFFFFIHLQTTPTGGAVYYYPRKEIVVGLYSNTLVLFLLDMVVCHC